MPRVLCPEKFGPKSVCIVHVVQRCIRRAYLAGADVVIGKNFEHLREWIRCRMERLSSVFDVDVFIYALLSCNRHSVILTRPDVIAAGASPGSSLFFGFQGWNRMDWAFSGSNEAMIERLDYLVVRSLIPNQGFMRSISSMLRIPLLADKLYA